MFERQNTLDWFSTCVLGVTGGVTTNYHHPQWLYSHLERLGTSSTLTISNGDHFPIGQHHEGVGNAALAVKSSRGGA